MNNVFTQQTSFLKHLEFQYRQHRVFVFICGLLLSGIIFGALFFPHESNHSLVDPKKYTGVKDRRFVQNQILNMVRKKSKKQFGHVKRIKSPNYSQFVKYVQMNRPFIINGMMKNWKAMKSWNNDYFRKKIGDIKLLVENSKDNTFYGGASFYNMKMKDFLDVYSKKDRKSNYYVAEVDIDNFGMLKNDFPKKLSFVPNLWQHYRTQFWIGAGNQLTPMHRDASENLLCQIKGSRTVKLYDPLQVDLLYLNPSNEAYSLVDPLNPDYTKYPLFKNAKPLEATINPGEILYLPVSWFHHVKSNEGENLAINYWYEPDSESFYHTTSVLSSLFWKDPYDKNAKIVKNRKQKISKRILEMKLNALKNVKEFNPELEKNKN
eukprot:gene11582-4826_t